MSQKWRKQQVISTVGIIFATAILLGNALVTNTAMAAAPLRLSIYAPGEIGWRGDTEIAKIMKQYMIYPTDMLVYQPVHASKFPGIAILDGGYCISCTVTVGGTKNIKQAIADAPKYGTTVIGYNMEHWEYTPSEEKVDPVASVDKAAQMAHNAGLEFMFNPDGGYLWNKASADGYSSTQRWYTLYHWENIDYLLMQFQSHRYAGGKSVSGTDIEAFKANVQTVASFAKSKNPDIKIFVQLSLSFNPPDIIIKKTNALESLSEIDGVTYFYKSTSKCTYCTPENIRTVLSELRPTL